MAFTYLPSGFFFPPSVEGPFFSSIVSRASLANACHRGPFEEEKEAAQKSQKVLEDLVLHKTVYLKDCGNEKYGRLLANVFLEEKEIIHVNNWMIENGDAVEYRGGTKIPFATSSGSPKS